ncbi:MAG: zinc dependent phospholipase C family protein [Peptostreptococcaceae bacterium]|nr:zinc dependent phospholipase C family protein [Peptostreptococcaceae bacterium]
MFVQSHKIMADHIYHYVEEHSGLSLNLLRFRAGNMSPDLPLYHSHLKHYKHQNFEYILDMVQKLSESKPLSNVGALKNYSYKLGVICHYLCDYFCYPHHNRRYFHDKLGEHLKYERDLHKVIKKFRRSDHLPQYYFNEILAQNPDRQFNVLEMIEEFHRDYMSERPSFYTDSTYAISVTSIIASIIVLASIGKASLKISIEVDRDFQEDIAI